MMSFLLLLLFHNTEQSFKDTKVFVIGMPKCGTSSIAGFFRCARSARVSHHACGHQGLLCADCLARNAAAHVRSRAQERHLAIGKTVTQFYIVKLPLLTGCDDFGVYAELDDPASCVFPQVSLLDALVAEFEASAVFVLNERPVANWVRSVTYWNNGDAKLVCVWVCLIFFRVLFCFVLFCFVLFVSYLFFS